jgi:hypothetical protein
VPVRVGDVKKALAPLRIPRLGVGAVAGSDCAGVQRIDVGIVEDHAPPPRPAPLGRLRDQIEIARSSPEAGELRVLAAVKKLESQRAIKPNCPPHVVGRERDRTDALDHAGSARPTLPSWPVPRIKSEGKLVPATHGNTR